MIRMIQSISASHAKSYFSDALLKSDYYLDDQELQGKIRGLLAERLELSGTATKDVFFDLCENINPATGKMLTSRTKEERTVGYDLNFHCPKSVSILHVLSKDDHILTAFEKSVLETMQDIERDSKTRVRTQGRDQERDTGELIWSDFIHQTARPVDGSLPDPHLHAHCFVFNATWDETENRIKACQFRDIKRDMPYYQACFQKRFSDKLIELGYEIESTKSSFEVKGVPQNVIDLFSKRTDEIGRVAKEKGITGAKELSELGARTRSKKQKGYSMDDLKSEWRKQIHELNIKQGKSENAVIRFAKNTYEKLFIPKQCIDYTIEHCFERASVNQDRRLLAAAYHYGIGHKSVSIDDINTSFKGDERFIHVKEKGRIMTTTREVLLEEQKMVKLARQGQGHLIPLYKKIPEIKLQGQQRDAVEHVLSTTNRVSIVTGKAGTGKTTTLQELVPLIENSGKRVMMVAPTAESSRGVLRQEGFQQADTVAKLLADKQMQKNLLGQVLIVEEAGLLGTKGMASILELVNKQNSRLILIGDTRQHTSVDRGDALRILNTVGEIKTAEISKIYRQRNGSYKKAVEELAIGNIQSAFEKLDRMGAIQTIDPLNPHEILANDYIRSIKNKKTALVISPTHKQSEEVTNAIREKMKSSGLLGKKELEGLRLQNLNLTEAQKGDWRNIKAGQVVQFSQNLKNVSRGSLWTISESTKSGVLIQNAEGQTISLPTERSKDYDLYEQKTIQLAKNDIIRITRNGFDEQKKRLNNQQILEVLKVSKNGRIKLKSVLSDTEYELDKNFGHINHAYCITSHASQGKTVDEVLISQPASTFPATNSKQFYVSVSRAREKVKIYTDDKIELMAHASQLGDRQSAIELVRKRDKGLVIIEQHIKDNLHNKPVAPQKDRIIEITKKAPIKDLSYEPKL